jgi:acyl carrier protein
VNTAQNIICGATGEAPSNDPEGVFAHHTSTPIPGLDRGHDVRYRRFRTMNPLNDAIRTYVVNEYAQNPDQVIEDSTPLISGGIVDSFSMVSLKRYLERTYKITIPDRMATPEAFDTIETIAALVRQLQPGD